MRHIVLNAKEKPLTSSMDLQWFCECTGISSGRDTEKTMQKIMAVFLKRFEHERGVSAEDIASAMDMNVMTINHHIRNLIRRGFIYRKKKLLYLRGGSLHAAIEELQKDALHMFSNISQVAKQLDKKYKLKKRF